MRPSHLRLILVSTELNERETTMTTTTCTILNATTRQPAITGTLNQTTKSDREASTFATREEAEAIVEWLCAEHGFKAEELAIKAA